MFKLITKVSDLRGLYYSSNIYSYQLISEECDIGKDVWIQYYHNTNEKNGTFTIGDSICMMGDVPTIMLYIENDDKSDRKTYNVYRYNGDLSINRNIVENFRHDILLNIDTIASNLKLFLNEDKEKQSQN